MNKVKELNVQGRNVRFLTHNGMDEEKYLLLEKNCNINSGCRKNYKEDYWLEEFSKLEKKTDIFVVNLFHTFCLLLSKNL